MIRTRGGGGGGKEKGRQALAWISFGFAAVGGAALASTFVGGIIANVMGIGPDWLAVLTFVGAFIAMAVDLFIDGEPNQLALYIAMLLPSLARAVPGRLGDSVNQVSTQLLAQVNQGLGEWLGVAAGIGLAIVCVLVAHLIGRRVLAKGGA